MGGVTIRDFTGGTPVRAYFNHLLRAVAARSALFEKQNTFFSTKSFKNRCLFFFGGGGGGSVLNALNLQQ